MADLAIRKGYNDSPKPCIKCDGKIIPTNDPHVGECNKCGKKVHWSLLK